MNNENKDIPGFEETHSRLESLSILDCNTIQDIQDAFPGATVEKTDDDIDDDVPF